MTTPSRGACRSAVLGLVVVLSLAVAPPRGAIAQSPPADGGDADAARLRGLLSLPWIVGLVSGEVQVQSRARTAAELAIARRIEAGEQLSAGRDGRAVLTRGSDLVAVEPGGILALGEERREGGFTRFLQEIGDALFEVEPLGERRFEVETPDLNVVVKGTSFRVRVDDVGTAVEAGDGYIEVAPRDRRMIARFPAGFVASIGRTPGAVIEVHPVTDGGVR